jgi:hypothetical protein
VRRQGRLAIAVLLAILPLGCGGGARRAERSGPVPAAQQRPDPRELQRCRNDRRDLPPLLDAFQRQVDRVAAIEAESYVPAAGPPPLDPEEVSRLAIYDQEIVQEEYDQAHAAWQEQERLRRASWRQERAARLADARQARDQLAAALRQRWPSVLSADDPALLRQAEHKRLLHCEAGPHS